MHGDLVLADEHAAVVRKQDFSVYLNGLGVAQAWTSVSVRSRVDGQVEKIAFEEGQAVQAGDVLVQLDSRPLKAALDQATAKITQDTANLSSAKTELERTRPLMDKGYATKQLFDQQTSTVNQLQALVKADEAAQENAKVSLGFATITAPVSGRVGLRTIDIGNIVHANDTNGIVTIAEVQPIAVIFTAPEDQVLQRGGTIRLKGKFENSGNALWPGLSVTTRLLVSTIHAAVVAPQSAVQRGSDGLFAYVVGPDQKVEKRTIQIGPSDDGFAVIETGLSSGDEVVTAGHYRLQPGVTVAVEGGIDSKTAIKQPELLVE